jgi:hypothetical protein
VREARFTEEGNMSAKEKVHGEGNYEASRKYDEATKKFVASGRVEQAARDAAPKTPAEAAEMKMAEQAALLMAKGVNKKMPPKAPDGNPQPIGDPGPPGQNPADTPPRRGEGPDRR